MATQLAWHNLIHNKVKTSVAVAGVVFAIVLMFMQLGFLEAVKASATLVYDDLNFDICLRSNDYLNLADARNISRALLQRAAPVQGVKTVVPLNVASNAWRNPENGQRLAVLCLGVEPEEPVFRNPDTAREVRRRLSRPNEVLIDTKTRREYGPLNGEAFDDADIGRSVEINGQAMVIAGTYRCGAGLSCGAATIMTDRGLQHLTPGMTGRDVNLGLITLVSDADAAEVAELLRGEFGKQIQVLTRDEVLHDELKFWVYDTNYGLIFQLGVIVSLIVGTAIVYQVLVSDVASHLPEYATLKAMGYSNRYLTGVLLQQAVALAILGFIIGVILSLALYAITTAGAQIPVRMTRFNLGLVFLLTVVMCCGSGLAALRKAFKADPAALF